MFLLIPLAFALARGGGWNLVAAGIIMVAEAFTYSRGPWVGTLVVLVCWPDGVAAGFWPPRLCSFRERFLLGQ